MTEALVQQTNSFLRVYKKPRNNQKQAADQAIAAIVRDPAIGGSEAR
ncbi:MAG: type II toxin-antitoxin system RelE/ParE family toxin [Sulfuriferula sp.]